MMHAARQRLPRQGKRGRRTGRALRHQHGASATHRGRPTIQTHHRQAPMAQTSSSTPRHVRPAPPALPHRPRHARSAPRSRGSSGAVGVNSVAGRSGRAGWAGRLPGTDDAPAQRRWRTAPYARRSTGVHLILQRRGPDLWLNVATGYRSGYGNRLRKPVTRPMRLAAVTAGSVVTVPDVTGYRPVTQIR